MLVTEVVDPHGWQVEARVDQPENLERISSGEI